MLIESCCTEGGEAEADDGASDEQRSRVAGFGAGARVVLSGAVLRTLCGGLMRGRHQRRRWQRFGLKDQGLCDRNCDALQGHGVLTLGSKQAFGDALEGAGHLAHRAEASLRVG